jgi:hypothetical protein
MVTMTLRIQHYYVQTNTKMYAREKKGFECIDSRMIM